MPEAAGDQAKDAPETTMRITKNRRKQGGMTLVELAVGSVTTALALTGTVAATLSGTQLSQASAEADLARRAAEALLEEVRATPFAAIDGSYDGISHDIVLPGHTGISAVAATSVVEITTGSPRWSALQVTVDVQWDGTHGPESLALITFVADRAAGSGLGAAVVPADQVDGF